MTQTRYSPQRKLRIMNVDFLNSVGFIHLEHTPWISYSESPPMECARVLHEGEVDLALIPIVEFVRMGGYRPLPFGIAAEGAVESVVLLSERPLQELDTILLDSASQTSVVMLKCILRKFYPEQFERLRFERMTNHDPVIRGSVGAMMIGDRARDLRGEFAHSIDLAELWKTHTGLPFIFAIWAGRPENIDDETADELITLFQKSIPYAEIYARDWAEQQNVNRELVVGYIENAIRYTVGAEEVKGANVFLALAQENQWLPDVQLQSPGSEENPSRFLRLKQRSIEQILSEASHGKRLAVHDLRSMVEQLSPTHMLFAAELARTRDLDDAQRAIYRNCEISMSNVSITATRYDTEYVQPGDASEFVLPWDEIARRIESLPRVQNRQITLTCGLHPELDLDYFCWIIQHIKSEFRVRVAALSPEHIWFLSQNTNLEVERILYRLKSVGLDLVGDRSSFLLLDRVRRRAGPVDFNTEAAIQIYRESHRIGLMTVAGFPVSPADSWRDRWVHLKKIRELQDDTFGFAYVNCHPIFANEDRTQKSLNVIDYLLAVSSARLLLDNISVVETTPVGFGTPVAEATLHAGADTHVDTAR